ncbi:VanW family protein [Bacillus testis]|uniref:VanW family protein n=1 Tax=Bacillus testis TaxID=1622072 RepID=UPI00067F58D9|nr:VanW family protein [Bacillus testis]
MKKIYMWIITATIVVLAAGGAIYGYIYKTANLYNDTFYPHVTVEGQDLTNKTKEEATKLLAAVTAKHDLIKVNVKVGNQTFTTSLKNIGVQYDTKQKMDQAYSFGKNEGLLARYKLAKEKKGKEYHLTYTINENLLNKWVGNIEQKMKKAPQNASISIRNGFVSIKDDTKGYQINQDQLRQDLSAALQKNNKEDITVAAQLQQVPAKITKETLTTVHNVIGSFTTNYTTGAKELNRNTNIKIAAETIDSYLLMPGESFSFNDFVGDTTADKGYKAAGTYEGGKVVESYGGGVCQVSTTLYNAIIKAGIIPNKRYNHSMTVGYVPVGQDAAIAFPYKDLEFSNPYPFPVYIEGVVGPGTLTFKVYSSAKAKPANVDYRLDSSIVSKTPDHTQSVTYLETLKNGKMIERKVINRDHYLAHK